ncbi:MAG: response regulator [Deltaproteobacteria bacterium]|jgi:signal transduction histidine kinase/ActR/RegA family two-component response regulator|nr:response regulator [Deltaproteobacteria bacterium]MBW2535233.1 response regulator [Deltaproteobacteria bacterium]
MSSDPPSRPDDEEPGATSSDAASPPGARPTGSSLPAPAPDEYSFVQIMEAIADGVSVVDADFSLRFVNSAMVRDFGPYEGKTCYEYYVDRDTPCPWCNNEEVFAGNTTRYQWSSDKNGKTYDLIDTPLRNADGTVSKLEIFRDVTERLQLEQQLQQSQKMEAIGRLAGGVAHDFNNVLAVIIGNADFARDALGSDHPVQEDLTEILKAAERAAHLVSQLLAFSRRQVLQPRQLDLNEVVETVEKMLRRLLGEDIALETSLARGVHPVQADPGQMQQVLLNMALNARDAMPRGGTLRIETANAELDEELTGAAHPAPTGPGVRLTVVDTGVGMDELTLRRVFEPFYTTKPVGQGTGLGLSMVYGIVKQSGGEICVDSEIGRGSRFSVYLPAMRRAEEDDDAPLSAPPSSRRALTPSTVLLVEDDAAVRRSTRRMLTRRGLVVLEASRPGEAFTVSRDHAGPIDVLVTDVVLPEMNGFELYRRLLQERADLQVLYISGHTDEAVALREPTGRPPPILQKPFSADDLIRRVRVLATVDPVSE